MAEMTNLEKIAEMRLNTHKAIESLDDSVKREDAAGWEVALVQRDFDALLSAIGENIDKMCPAIERHVKPGIPGRQCPYALHELASVLRGEKL